MFKIGEFSKLGQVSTRMLRHYDKLGLLEPDQTDQWTGYRYYSIEQLSRLHRIIALKDLGLSLEQITHLLSEQEQLPVDQLRGMLRMRQADITEELQAKREQLKRVEARLNQLEKEGQPSPYEIVVKSLPAQPVASIQQLVPHIHEMGFYCQTMYHTLYKRLGELGIRPLTPEITLYHNEEYQEHDLEVETAIAVTPKVVQSGGEDDLIQLRTLPEVDLAASLIYEGTFKGLEEGVLALLTYVGTHKHIIAGPMRELHLSGPAHPDGQTVADTAVIELQIPIRPLD